MDSNRFKELLEELDGNSVKTLAEKNARYSSNGDALHNFRSGADIAGGTPAQACWGYLTKHLVALRDMVEKDDFSNREDFLEKCQDTINYVRFLWCIGNDKQIIERCDKPHILTSDILFDTEQEARNVFREMCNIRAKYGFVTVADMYDMAGLTASYTSNDYGWVTLPAVTYIEQCENKHRLVLPKPYPLNPSVNNKEKESE